MRTMIAVHEIPSGDGSNLAHDFSALPEKSTDSGADEWVRRKFRGFDGEGNIWRLVEVAMRNGVVVSARNDTPHGRGLSWKPKRWEREFDGTSKGKPGT